jgi:hypothetical protein
MRARPLRRHSVSPTKIHPTLLVHAWLENTLNSYALRSTLCASRIGVRLLA